MSLDVSISNPIIALNHMQFIIAKISKMIFAAAMCTNVHFGMCEHGGHVECVHECVKLVSCET